MKSSNLAQRLEELEAVMESLQLTPPPTARIAPSQEAVATTEAPRPVRRSGRVRAIQIRDQGLRGFRVF